MPAATLDIYGQLFAHATPATAAARAAVSAAHDAGVLTISVAPTSEPITLKLGSEALGECSRVVCHNAAHNLTLLVRAGGAGLPKLTLELRNAENSGATVLLAIDGGPAELHATIQLGRMSRLAWFSCVSGSADLGVDADMTEGVQAQFFGLTRVKDHDEARVAMHVRHVEGKNHSGQKFYSYAADDSAVTFTGRITVLPGAGESVAHQLHRGTALSDGARISAQPFLNIMHDDVRCTHGSTVGFIDEHAKRYLMARGLDNNAAEKMLIESSQSQFIAALPDGGAAFFGLAGAA